jgi:bifunctional non-homologous end joining protein LigD
MRALREPSVSTPVTWDEVERCGSGEDTERLRFAPGAVLERVEEFGDLFSDLVG